MVGIFKQKSPANALLLFGYALVLKLPVFLHPWLPGLHEQDNYLYRFILSSLHSIFGNAVWIYGLLTFLMLFAQATLLNSIFNFHRILPKSNYLPGMAYILVTSLIPDWNHFSAPLIINFLLIWAWYRMVALDNSHSPVGGIFNIGIFLGLATLLYLPAVAFLLLLFFALLIMRPFRLQEWFAGFIGFTAPYYFLILGLYFTHQLHWRNLIPDVRFALPAYPKTFWLILGLAMLVIPFMWGGFFVQNNLNKMLIHVRKSWSLLLVLLIVGVVVILITRADNYENWIVTAMPFAAFHSAGYYYSPGKRAATFMHWACFAACIAVNYG